MSTKSLGNDGKENDYTTINLDIHHTDLMAGTQRRDASSDATNNLRQIKNGSDMVRHSSLKPTMMMN